MNAFNSNDIGHFKARVKNVPNFKLKGETFDALHLDQFILQDQVIEVKPDTGNQCENSNSNKFYNVPPSEPQTLYGDGFDTKTSFPRTGYSKSRKTVRSHYSSANTGYTNIRPSHYFISIPRNSVSYKISEVSPNESSAVPKKTNNFMINNKDQSRYEQELTRYDENLKTWNKNEIPTVPSERRKEVQDASTSIKEYQNLK